LPSVASSVFRITLLVLTSMVSLTGTHLQPEINPRFRVALPDGISEKRDWAPYSCMPRAEWNVRRRV